MLVNRKPHGHCGANVIVRYVRVVATALDTEQDFVMDNRK